MNDLPPTLEEFLKLRESSRGVFNASEQSWRNLAAPKPRRVSSEAYMDAECALHIHLRIQTHLIVVPTDFCAIYIRENGGHDKVTGGYRCCSAGGSPLWLDALMPNERGDYGRVPVFIHAPKFVKNPQRVRHIVVPSKVRLQGLDQCQWSVSNFPTFGDTGPLTFSTKKKLVTIGVERELCALHGLPCFADIKNFNQIIEGGTRLMNHVPNENPESSRWNLLQYSEALDIVSRLGVELLDDVVHVTFGEGMGERLNFTCESVDVFVTPLNPLLASHELLCEGTHGLQWKGNVERTTKTHPENAKGARDSRAHKGRIRGGLRQGGEAGEEITDSPPEEGLTRTSPDHRLGGYTATHTRSGSPEDA